MELEVQKSCRAWEALAPGLGNHLCILNFPSEGAAQIAFHGTLTYLDHF